MTGSVDPPVYERVDGDARLRQGEVICNLIQTVRRFSDADAVEIEEVEHPYAIVITQDCDLEQDYRGRTQKGKGNLPNVLLIDAFQVPFFKDQVPKGSDIWKRITQNKDERYQYLEPAPPIENVADGLPDLGIDFKRYFTVETSELLHQISAGTATRRYRLATPYGEHLALRFGYYQARIPLPRDHGTPLPVPALPEKPNEPRE